MHLKSLHFFFHRSSLLHIRAQLSCHIIIHFFILLEDFLNPPSPQFTHSVQAHFQKTPLRREQNNWPSLCLWTGQGWWQVHTSRTKGFLSFSLDFGAKYNTYTCFWVRSLGVRSNKETPTETVLQF